MLAATLICGASVFTSCSSDNDDKPNQTNLETAQKLVGKWIYTEADGEMVETIETSVTTFLLEGSELKAYTSISLNDYGVWANRQPTDVTFDGNKITLTMQMGDITTVEEMTDVTISGDDLRYTSNYRILRGGEIIEVLEPYKLHCTRIHDDFSETIIGSWIGVVTSDDPEFTPQPFCEEYLANGTNIAYSLASGQWTKEGTEYAEYFVDGNLLCARWENVGESENREWWEITIEDDVMNWTALRRNADGTTFTATFQMTKVQ